MIRFALSHARFSATIARIYNCSIQRMIARPDENGGGKALQLQPIWEGHLALGSTTTGPKRITTRPRGICGGGQVPAQRQRHRLFAPAAIRRRQGSWTEQPETAHENPNDRSGNSNVAQELAYTYSFSPTGRSDPTQDRVITLAPDSSTRKSCAPTSIFGPGSTAALTEVLGALPPASDPQACHPGALGPAMIQRDYVAADHALAVCPLELFKAGGQPTPKSFYWVVSRWRGAIRTRPRTHFGATLPIFEGRRANKRNYRGPARQPRIATTPLWARQRSHPRRPSRGRAPAAIQRRRLWTVDDRIPRDEFYAGPAKPTRRCRSSNACWRLPAGGLHHCSIHPKRPSPPLAVGPLAQQSRFQKLLRPPAENDLQLGGATALLAPALELQRARVPIE